MSIDEESIRIQLLRRLASEIEGEILPDFTALRHDLDKFTPTFKISDGEPKIFFDDCIERHIEEDGYRRAPLFMEHLIEEAARADLHFKGSFQTVTKIRPHVYFMVHDKEQMEQFGSTDPGDREIVQITGDVALQRVVVKYLRTIMDESTSRAMNIWPAIRCIFGPCYKIAAEYNHKSQKRSLLQTEQIITNANASILRQLGKLREQGFTLGMLYQTAIQYGAIIVHNVLGDGSVQFNFIKVPDAAKLPSKSFILTP